MRKECRLAVTWKLQPFRSIGMVTDGSPQQYERAIYGEVLIIATPDS